MTAKTKKCFSKCRKILKTLVRKKKEYANLQTDEKEDINIFVATNILNYYKL